jgi:hypothetical protein
MTDLDYALQTLPEALLRWIVRQVRSGAITPEQAASQFVPSENDPRRAIVARGLAQIAKMPERKLPDRLK